MPAPGDTADPGADFLNHRHQRETENHGPGEAVTELSADLAIGRDPAGIVIRGTSNETRPQTLEEATQCHGVDDGASMASTLSRVPSTDTTRTAVPFARPGPLASQRVSPRRILPLP